MHDGLEPGKRRFVVDDDRGKLTAVDFAVPRRAGEGALDGGHRFTRVKRMHDRVRIMDRHPGVGKHFGGGRFAHAERAGQAQNEWPRAAHCAKNPCRRRKSNAVVSGRPNTLK